MKPKTANKLISIISAIAFSFSGCSTPTLVEIARSRQVYTDESNGAYKGNRNAKDDVRVKYSLTDWDVLNFTDEVKRRLLSHSNFHMGVRYGSAGTQATLGALAGAAKTLGWGASASSGYGMGATYIFGLGQIFDSKGHAQAYEQAFTAIQAAEATYYFHQLGMGFNSVGGSKTVDLSLAQSRSDIPSDTQLTTDGETLYYRVSKILKVLEDTLASKIPDLQDLKDANGEAGSQASPLRPVDSIALPPRTKETKITTQELEVLKGLAAKQKQQEDELDALIGPTLSVVKEVRVAISKKDPAKTIDYEKLMVGADSKYKRNRADLYQFLKDNKDKGDVLKSVRDAAYLQKP
jgi:hypothetical protein